MDINEILSKLSEKESPPSRRTPKQTLLLLCLEKQIIQNDIVLHEQNLTQKTENFLEYEGMAKLLDKEKKYNIQGLFASEYYGTRYKYH